MYRYCFTFANFQNLKRFAQYLKTGHFFLSLLWLGELPYMASEVCIISSWRGVLFAPCYDSWSVFCECAGVANRISHSNYFCEPSEANQTNRLRMNRIRPLLTNRVFFNPRRRCLNEELKRQLCLLLQRHNSLLHIFLCLLRVNVTLRYIRRIARGILRR